MAHLVIYHHFLVCDTNGCGEGTPDFETEQEAVTYAEAEGWHITKNSHTCPDCYAKVKAIFAEVDDGSLAKTG